MWPPKLSCGGGDGMDHSSVVACHGLSVAFIPFFTLHRKLKRKINCEPIVMNAAMEINFCTGINGYKKVAPLKSAYRRGCPTIPSQCVGKKIAYTPTNVSQK